MATMNSLTDIWSVVMDSLSQELTQTAINTWFSDCTPIEINNNTLIVHTTSDFKRSIIQARFEKTICAKLYDLFSCPFELVVLAGDDELLEYREKRPSAEEMPEMDGYELVSSLRTAGYSIPVMMITAKDAFDDMRMGFVSGTDDYMVKPVNVNEMVLRVGALLRRAQMINDRRLVIGGTVMECDSLTVTWDGQSAVLPQKEFMLLYKMASFPGRIFTRQQLMDDIWGYDSDTDTHTVDVHIGRLRDRFRDSKDFKIVTMRGVGYKVVKA